MRLHTPPARRLAASLAVTGLLGATSLALAPGASASPRTQPCIWPDTGTNLQQYFGVSTSLVIPFGGCGTVPAGSAWSTPVVFYVARTWEQIPAGITPIGATPLEELEKRVTKMRLIVDEGTRQAFTVERTIDQLHFATASWQEVYPADPDWLLVDLGTHITMRPLPVGQHTVRGEFEVNGPTCDGTTTDVELSCLPTGLFQYPSARTFQVVAN